MWYRYILARLCLMVKFKPIYWLAILQHSGLKASSYRGLHILYCAELQRLLSEIKRER